MVGFREATDPDWRQNLPRHPRDFIARRRFALDECLPIVDRILEPQTVFRFLESAASGNLPTRDKHTSPLMPVEVLQKYLMIPYTQWAPGPHDEFGVSPLDHVLIRIGSKNDGKRLVAVEKGVHTMKGRLWDGIMPISERRWRDKRLDDPENHHLACRYIGQVIEVFAYLQHPPIMEKLTETYRLIHGHFSDFDRAVNSLPERASEPPVGLAALWEAFMTAHYTAMTTRAHSWVISKTSRLRDRDQDLMALRRWQDTAGSGLSVSVDIPLTNRNHDLAELSLRADVTIFVHMPASDPPVSRLLPTWEIRLQQTAQAVRQRSHQNIIADTVWDPRNETLSETADFIFGGTSNSLLTKMESQREAQNFVRNELRGEPIQLPPVGWIRALKEKMESNNEDKWGFTAYRLTYKESDEEWSQFVGKLEKDLNDWGEGEYGARDIKSKACLTWLNGQELGIPENDLEAAKRHYNTLPNTEAQGWTDTVFLAIDSSSYDSYIHGSPFSDLLLPGDTGGFVTVVDASFDPNDPSERAGESPLYPGWLRILGSLIYSDLYALLASSVQTPEELWPLAMNHPELVYTGPTVKAQVEHWKKVSVMKLQMLEILRKQLHLPDATRATI